MITLHNSGQSHPMSLHIKRKKYLSPSRQGEFCLHSLITHAATLSLFWGPSLLVCPTKFALVSLHNSVFVCVYVCVRQREKDSNSIYIYIVYYISIHPYIFYIYYILYLNTIYSACIYIYICAPYICIY